MSNDNETYNKFYQSKDWDHKLGELKWQVKAYLKYVLLERKLPINTILDIGCGTGDHCYLFDSLEYKVVGVDFAKSAIEKARDKYKWIKFYVADANDLELTQKFDFIFASGFSVFNTEDLDLPKKTIKNWISRLENNGTILILSRTDLSGFKSSSGWFFHTEEQIMKMYSHPDFSLKLYFAYPKLRYLILLPLFEKFWVRIVHIISKYIFAKFLKIPVRYLVIMKRNQ